MDAAVSSRLEVDLTRPICWMRRGYAGEAAGEKAVTKVRGERSVVGV